MSKPKQKKVPKLEIRTAILPSYEGRLQDWLEQAYDAGFELLTPPTMTHRGEPSGMNGYAVGFHHPHFMIIVGRKNAQ